MPHVSDRDLSPAELQGLLGARLTYPEVGATLGELPSGYRQIHEGRIREAWLDESRGPRVPFDR